MRHFYSSSIVLQKYGQKLPEEFGVHAYWGVLTFIPALKVPMGP